MSFQDINKMIILRQQQQPQKYQSLLNYGMQGIVNWSKDACSEPMQGLLLIVSPLATDEPLSPSPFTWFTLACTLT